MRNTLIALVTGLAIMRFCGFATAESSTTPATAADAARNITAQNIKVHGSLDLENGVPIRWKKPDGTGYINIFMLDKNGSLQLCHDPYYFEQPKQDLQRSKSDDPQHREERRVFEQQHETAKVIEVRNPNSAYPDLRVPITRSQPGGKRVWDADSKLMARSATFIETNDPAELNLIRTGNDAKPVNDEDAPTGDAITGIVRFQGRTGPPDYPGQLAGYTTDAEIASRKYGATQQNHYASLLFKIFDSRFPKLEGPVMQVMTPGVRIGHDGEKMNGKTGAMLEVDSAGDRPVMILRQERASAAEPVVLALATGENGAAADAGNSLALIKASPRASDTLTSRLEIQTNKGDRLETDWVLPVPAAEASNGDAQRIAAGQAVVLTFNQKRYDTDAMYQADKGGTRLTCRTAGRYAVGVSLEFSANGNGSRQVLVRRNGREQVAAMRVPAVDGETTQIAFTAPPIDLKPGDYVELLVRQTSGTVLEIPGNGEIKPTVAITRVG